MTKRANKTCKRRKDKGGRKEFKTKNENRWGRWETGQRGIRESIGERHQKGPDRSEEEKRKRRRGGGGKGAVDDNRGIAGVPTFQHCFANRWILCM